MLLLFLIADAYITLNYCDKTKRNTSPKLIIIERVFVSVDREAAHVVLLFSFSFTK